MERRMTDMKQRTLPRQSIGILYGCLMALQGVFYLQSPFPDRFDVGGKWEAPLCYSILFICLACIWFQNIWRRRAEWIRPKRIRVGFVDRRRDAGLPDLLLVAVRPYYPVCGAVRNTACPGLHPISYSVCSVYTGAFVRTKKI